MRETGRGRVGRHATLALVSRRGRQGGTPQRARLRGDWGVNARTHRNASCQQYFTQPRMI
eukprot:scaffold20287_cov63-Phaeocystis_antarctica.AAC.3